MASKIILALLLCAVVAVQADVKGQLKFYVDVEHDEHYSHDYDVLKCQIYSIEPYHSHHNYVRYIAHPDQYEEDVDWVLHESAHDIESCSHAANQSHHSMFFVDDHHNCYTSYYHYVRLEEECHPQHGKLVYMLVDHDYEVHTHGYCTYGDHKIYDGQEYHIDDVGCGSPGYVVCHDGEYDIEIDLYGHRMTYMPSKYGTTNSGCITDIAHYNAHDRYDACKEHHLKPCAPKGDDYIHEFLDQVHHYIIDHDLENMTMGLSYDQSHSQWVYDNGVVQSDSHWADGYPQNSEDYPCSLLDHHDRLYNIDCYEYTYHTCCIVPDEHYYGHHHDDHYHGPGGDDHHGHPHTHHHHP